jgi:flagellar motor switch protein FliM
VTTSVRPHDFHHRETIDRHYLVTLNGAFDDFARYATVELSTLLGKPAHLALRQVAERPWQDIVTLMGDQPYLATFTLHPLESHAFLSTSRLAALRWVEFRLGGGTGPQFKGHTDPTDTDFAVLSGLVTPLLDLLVESLSAPKDVSASLVAQEATSQFVQMAGPGEMFLMASFELVVAGDAPVDLFVALPIPLVRQFSDVLRSGTRPAEGEALLVDETVVLQAPIQLWLEIPAVELSPQEISNLAVGDVIPFLHPLHQPLDVRAEGVLVARATQGHIGSKIVCSLTEEVVEDDR